MDFQTWLQKQEEIFEKTSQGFWNSDNTARPYVSGDPFSENGAGIYLSENNDHNIVYGGQQDEQGGGVGFVKNEDAEFAANAHNIMPFLLEVLGKITTMHSPRKNENNEDSIIICLGCNMLYPCRTIDIIKKSYESFEIMYEK